MLCPFSLEDVPNGKRLTSLEHTRLGFLRQPLHNKRKRCEKLSGPHEQAATRRETKGMVALRKKIIQREAGHGEHAKDQLHLLLRQRSCSRKHLRYRKESQ